MEEKKYSQREIEEIFSESSKKLAELARKEKEMRKEHMIEMYIMYKELRWERTKVMILAGLICIITIAAVMTSQK